MLENYPSDIWWKHISGPSALIKQIIQSISDNKSVLLISDPDRAWRREMRYTVQEHLSNDWDFEVEVYDIDNEMRKDETPEIFLMRKIPEKTSRKYKPHIDTRVQFLKKASVFKNKIIWIKGIPDERNDEWVAFLREWKKTSIQTGLFIIDVNGSVEQLPFPKHIDLLKYNDFITPYDTQIFLFLNDSKGFKNRLKLIYKVAVVTALCGTDGEVAELFYKGLDIDNDDPIDLLEKIYLEHYSKSPRGSHNSNLELGNQHPFYLIRNNLTSKLKKRLWKAQLQVLFPLIEESRMEFIQHYWDSIEKHLPLQAGYKGNIDNAYDMELGHLVLITGKANANGETLYIHRKEDYEHLCLLKTVRDTLAHNQPCNQWQVHKLINGHTFASIQP